MDYPLSDLRHHWGEAYAICHPAPETWIAQRLDTRETLRSATPEELRDKIIADYAARPVGRGVAPIAPRETPDDGCPCVAPEV